MQRVDQYPVASEFINKMMSQVMETVRKVPALKHKLFQANFQDSLAGEAMVHSANFLAGAPVFQACCNCSMLERHKCSGT